jgi:hypothetical protein
MALERSPTRVAESDADPSAARWITVGGAPGRWTNRQRMAVVADLCDSLASKQQRDYARARALRRSRRLSEAGALDFLAVRCGVPRVDGLTAGFASHRLGRQPACGSFGLPAQMTPHAPGELLPRATRQGRRRSSCARAAVPAGPKRRGQRSSKASSSTKNFQWAEHRVPHEEERHRRLERPEARVLDGGPFVAVVEGAEDDHAGRSDPRGRRRCRASVRVTGRGSGLAHLNDRWACSWRRPSGGATGVFHAWALAR